MKSGLGSVMEMDNIGMVSSWKGKRRSLISKPTSNSKEMIRATRLRSNLPFSFGEEELKGLSFHSSSLPNAQEKRIEKENWIKFKSFFLWVYYIKSL